MTIDGRYTQTADGVLHELVQRGGTPQLAVNGPAVELAGTVLVEPQLRSGVEVGDRYLLVDTDAPIQYSATMTSFYPGFTFEPRVVAGEGLYAVVTAVPEPAGAVGGAAVLLLLRRRRSRSLL